MSMVDDTHTMDSTGLHWTAHQCSECDGLAIVQSDGDGREINDMDFPPDVLMWLRRQIDNLAKGEL